eukprot:13497131-Ditylum_brightwellii.AAC.2
MIAPTKTINGIKCLLKAPSIFAITGQSMMKKNLPGSAPPAPLAPLGTMMIMEAILPRIVTPGRRHQRNEKKPPTLTPTEATGTGTGTLQLL